VRTHAARAAGDHDVHAADAHDRSSRGLTSSTVPRVPSTRQTSPVRGTQVPCPNSSGASRV
jgi:hypothetical protein